MNNPKDNSNSKEKKNQKDEPIFHNTEKAKGDLESGDNQAERKRAENLKESEGEKSISDEGF